MGARQNGDPAAGPGPAAASPHELVDRVQRLTSELERIGDPAAREAAEGMVGAVIELYGEGLERIFAAIDEDPELRDRLAGDGVVASLMLIHGLYPVGLEQRVREALDSVRPYMESHGGDVDLLGVESGIARIRLEGSCEGCPASASTLELAIKQALAEAAPDLEGLVVEGAVAPAAAAAPGALELPVVQATPETAERPPSWFDLDGVAAIGEGELVATRVRDVPMVVARVDGALLAFRDACADCGAPLAGGDLDDGVLRCRACERGYLLARAGRSLDDDRLLLAPVPLLASGSGARVAL